MSRRIAVGAERSVVAVLLALLGLRLGTTRPTKNPSVETSAVAPTPAPSIATSPPADPLLENVDNSVAAGDFSKPPAAIGRFLDVIETQPELHDADKLSFREVLSDVAETLSGIKSSAQAKLDLEHRVESDRKALAEIQILYEKELDKIFGRFETRACPCTARRGKGMSRTCVRSTSVKTF
jgi:hypothetical protein